MKNSNMGFQKFEKLSKKGKKRILEICRTAAQVFSEKGYISASLSDIAHAAGLSKGGIFYYFSTKEELLFLVLYFYMESTLTRLKKELEACSTPYEKIYVLIHHHIQNYVDNQAESRLALRERVNLSSMYLDVIKKMEKEYKDIVISLIEPVIRGRYKRAERLTLTSYTLLGMCTLPYTWFNPKGRTKPDELADVIYDLFIGGIETQNPTQTKRSKSG